MVRKLPPLGALRAFEAAGRHLSFSKAALELHVTPAAISHQVKALEEHCGRPLFRRLTRSLALTEAGAAALPLLGEGFDRLAEGAARLVLAKESRLLTVSASPSFCARWLMPRLDRFSAAEPDIDIRIDATDRLADFDTGGIDVALRYGTGNYPGLVSRCIMGEVVFPACSPGLLARRKLETPADLAHHTLLHVYWKVADDKAPNWRMWLKAAGVEGVDAERGPRFNVDSLVVQAAVDGFGVALVNRAIVAGDLAAGRLVRPFSPDRDEKAIFSYYLVHPPAHGENPKVRAFCDWVLAEAAADRA